MVEVCKLRKLKQLFVLRIWAWFVSVQNWRDQYYILFDFDWSTLYVALRIGVLVFCLFYRDLSKQKGSFRPFRY